MQPGWPPGFPRRRRPPPAGGVGADQTVLSLAVMLAQQVANMEHKPPVTLLLVAAQVLLFLRPEGLGRLSWVPSLRRGCLQPAAMLRGGGGGEWGRLLWSPWLHANALHLYYNMSSLLWKGSQLERQLGAAGFARLVAELALTSGGLYLALAAVLSARGRGAGIWRLLPGSGGGGGALGRSLMRSCAVGFSGVLFGMKVVLNHNSPGWSEVYGVKLPTKYVCWAELVIIQLLLPEASFTGHLCGILAGLLYVMVTSRFPGLPGGLPRGGERAAGARLRRLLARLFGWRRRGRGRTWGHGTWGGGGGDPREHL